MQPQRRLSHQSSGAPSPRDPINVIQARAESGGGVVLSALEVGLLARHFAMQNMIQSVLGGQVKEFNETQRTLTFEEDGDWFITDAEGEVGEYGEAGFVGLVPDGMTDWPVSFKVLPDFEPLLPGDDDEDILIPGDPDEDEEDEDGDE